MTDTLAAPIPAPVSRPTTGTRGKLAHIPALDGLRGIAVVGVLLFHANHLKGGWLGVDLFFVLSGYLITSLLMSEWGRTGAVKLSNFWVRRARRLFPALICVLLFVSLFIKINADPLDMARFRWDGFAALFYVANWRAILSGITYATANAADTPFKHMWSLAIEEQFYVVWPLAVLGLLRIRNRPDTILRASLAIAGTSVALMVGLHLSGVVSDNSLYYGTHTRIAAIAMGASLAAWQVWRGHTRNANTRQYIEIAAWFGVVFLAYAWTQVDVTDPRVYAGGLALCGLAVVAIIATASHPDTGYLDRVLTFAPFRWLGLISYGLYLWHWPIYLWLNSNLTHLHGWSLVSLQLFVSLDVAVLSYFLLEQPIRKGKLRGPQARAAVPAAIALVCIALLASSLDAEAGFTGHGNDTSIIPAASAGAPRLMVVGDSVADSIGAGIVPINQELGVSISNAGYVGCSLIFSQGIVRGPNGKPQGPPLTSDCTPHWPKIVNKIRPNIVLMVFGAFPVFTLEVNGHQYTACDQGFHDIYVKQVEKAVDTLSSFGAKVVIATGPSTDSNLIRQVANGMDITPRVDCVNNIYKEVARRDKRVAVVDLDAFVCPAKQPCVETIPDGQRLRIDGLHFKGEAAQYIARWLVPRVLAAAHKR